MADHQPDEDQLDACCDVCSSIWHSTANHSEVSAAGTTGLVGVPGTSDFPSGYDPAAADRLIGRDPDGGR